MHNMIFDEVSNRWRKYTRANAEIHIMQFVNDKYKAFGYEHWELWKQYNGTYKSIVIYRYISDKKY